MWGWLPQCYLVSWAGNQVPQRGGQPGQADLGARVLSCVTVDRDCVKPSWGCRLWSGNESLPLSAFHLNFSLLCLQIQISSSLDTKPFKITVPAYHTLEQTSCFYLSFQHHEGWIFTYKRFETTLMILIVTYILILGRRWTIAEKIKNNIWKLLSYIGKFSRYSLKETIRNKSASRSY